MFDVEKVRSEFPALERKINGFGLVYLDVAASVLKPRRVVERVTKHYLEGASNVHRGIHTLSNEATTDFENARASVQRLLNAETSDEIVFTKGTTEAMNLVANSYVVDRLSEKDTVLLTEMEHHSNIVPWQLAQKEAQFKIEVCRVTDSGDLDMEDFSRKVKGAKFVSVVHISNTTGAINNVKEIVRMGHEVGAKVAIDAAQSAAHLKLDVQELDCDFLAFSGHKLYGPTGVGVLYAKKEHLGEMPPYQGGGAMIDRVAFEGTTFADTPFRFEAGTPHIAGALGLSAAIEYLEDLGLNNVYEHESSITNYALNQMSEIEGLSFVGEPKNRSAIISFVVEGLHHHDIASLLDNYGVAVRSGHHCTQPLMKRFGIEGTVRASFGVFNTKADVDHFVESLNSSLKMLR